MPAKTRKFLIKWERDGEEFERELEIKVDPLDAIKPSNRQWPPLQSAYDVAYGEGCADKGYFTIDELIDGRYQRVANSYSKWEDLK